MTINVEVKGYPTFQFPDGTSPDTMRAAINKYIGSKSSAPGDAMPAMFGAEAPGMTPEQSKSVLEGIPSGALGWPGDLASLAHDVATNHPWTQYVPIVEIGSLASHVLPTSKGVADFLFGEPRTQVAETGRNIGELIGGLISPFPEGTGIEEGIGSTARGIGGLAARATGKEARTAAEALRTEALGRTSSVIEEQAKAAADYQKKLDAIYRAQRELATQPITAEARANQAALRTPQFFAERQRVLEELRARERALEEDYRQAGFSAQDAKKMVEEKDAKISDGENVVADLERQMLAQPRISADEFGAKIRQATKALDEKYRTIRATQSGFGKAIDDAQGYLRVNTAPIQASIDKQLKGIRNPSLERALTHIKELLKTGDKDGLSIRSADSLRGYLDSIINSRMMGDAKVDKETVYFIRKIKKDLVKSATEAWQPYREALGRWRTLSRPLDIVERNGALKKVVDADPLSTDYNLTEAQIVGDVIKSAKQGNPVFTRLIEESPELRDAARLYFTENLFGKDVAPTLAGFRTWLKDNERALRQTGLYDEFKDMKSARESAARAVEDAKSERKMSASELRSAQEKETAAKQRVALAENLRRAEFSRISELNAAKAKEDAIRAKEIEQRAGAASRRLQSERNEAVSSLSSHRNLMDRYQQLDTEITAASPEDAVSRTEALVKRLRDDKIIDDQVYGEALRKIAEVKVKFKDVARTRRILKGVLYGLMLATVGEVAWGSRHVVGSFMP
ncbi:MAG: hypothetical protein KGL39_07540 [Patescibacteria group bacterium]|nr:hypothetical protein [Patescibacteria group bacterium]